ncbi:hypothetical protein SLEP1_g42685 [Rubroshorea leprosula]|uniref:Uncharacterized protein n=1 Tax=Rubroshorea leprosula TaxID=152421 RepID=A0AAV5LB23_9ROSI|nr:hypothetical protein SLEP1_g42685 [Rubroshorea leprosula]
MIQQTKSFFVPLMAVDHPTSCFLHLTGRRSLGYLDEEAISHRF